MYHLLIHSSFIRTLLIHASLQIVVTMQHNQKQPKNASGIFVCQKLNTKRICTKRGIHREFKSSAKEVGTGLPQAWGIRLLCATRNRWCYHWCSRCHSCIRWCNRWPGVRPSASCHGSIADCPQRHHPCGSVLSRCFPRTLASRSAWTGGAWSVWQVRNR